MLIAKDLLARLKCFEQGHTLDAQDIEDALVQEFMAACAGVTVHLGEEELAFNEEESLEDGEFLFEGVWGSLDSRYVYFRAVDFDNFLIEEIDSTRYKVSIEKIFEARVETSESEFAYTIQVPGLFGITSLISKDNDGLVTDKDLQSVVENMAPDIEALAEIVADFTPEEGEEVSV